MRLFETDLIVLFVLFFQSSFTTTLYLDSTSIPFQKDSKSAAYSVLVTKCNVCHATKKRQDIFTLDNMNSLAIAIETQVFVKKKMPKGRKNNLSQQEYKTLKTWLDLTLQKE